MKDIPDELEHIVYNEHSEHDIENESIRKIMDGLEIEDHYFREAQLLEIEEAVQTAQDRGKAVEKEPAIRLAEPDFEIVHVHPVNFPEIIYDDKKQK